MEALVARDYPKKKTTCLTLITKLIHMIQTIHIDIRYIKDKGIFQNNPVSTSNFAIKLINRPHKTKVYIASLAIVQRNYYDAFVSVSKQSSSMLLDLQCEEANLSLPGGINTQKC